MTEDPPPRRPPTAGEPGAPPRARPPLPRRALGDRLVGCIGLGAMPMSAPGRPGRERSIATIHAALDAGVTLIDTADAYAASPEEVGHNERLVAEALRARPDRDEVVVATKGGHTRPPNGSWALDGRPEHLRRACDASLLALGVAAIDLYQLHRPDPAVPFAESVGALAELQAAGKVRLVGLSNVSVDQIDEARSIVAIASVQNELAPGFPSSIAEVRHCDRLGIAFLAWGPLGGRSSAGDLGTRHPAFAEVARRHGASPQQVALAWELSLAEVVVPIPGASRPASILDSLGAADLALAPEELARLTTAVVGATDGDRDADGDRAAPVTPRRRRWRRGAPGS